MKRIRWIVILTAAVLFLGLCAFAAAEEEAEPDEWTVMIYFCGSDLESKYGFASANLDEISSVDYPVNESIVYNPDATAEEYLRDLGKVNILIETGGSREWHTPERRMNIATDALQRWRYKYYPESWEEITKTHTFHLMETLPLRSMADPETLADFIRWGAQTCPAKKYALVLWDHGNGAKSIFFDELFDGDTLYLYELKQALAEGGVHLDTLILDACLMANLETAWNVKDYADYMVASEELVPGSGTAFGEWLNALVCHPTLDGQWLAKCVCDMTTVKYDNMEDEQSRSLLTWSVTDLSRIDRLIRACGDCIRNISSSLKDYPPLFPTQIALMTEGESFGEDRQKMLDLGGALFNDETCNFVDPRILDPVIDALSKAVIYLSRGQGRSKASGLTFCFLAGFSGEDLDLYARNFPMPSYLALLDAVSSWTAPEDVYTQAERLPEISGIERYRLKVEKTHTGSGIPAVSLTGPLLYAHYNLYRLDEETGETVFLGQANCGINDRGEERLAWAVDPMHWPALEGSLCCMSLVENNGDEILYNIPVQINTETAMLRCGRSNILEEDEIGENGYTVYGVWEGYDENSGLPGRSVKPLAMLAGQSYCMLYPRDGEMNSGTVSYLKGEKKTMYRSLRIKEEPLPAGTYWLEYQVSDLFMRVAKTDRIEIQWDGEKMSFPDGASWTGSIN